MSQYDEEYVTSWWSRQTPLGLFLKFVGLIIGLSIFFGAIGYFAGWFNEGKRIVGVDNVREQQTQLYEDYESLEAAARNYCALQKAEASATSPEERTQRTSQVLATGQNYEKIAADYDRRWANVFEGKLVGPRKLPTNSPTLAEMTKSVC